MSLIDEIKEMIENGKTYEEIKEYLKTTYNLNDFVIYSLYTFVINSLLNSE